jgi:hypothetical protein
MAALITRLYDFRRYHKFLLHNQETSVILMSAAVVCTRGDRDALSTSKPINSVRTDLVRSNHDGKLVNFEELLNHVSSIQSHVVLLDWVSYDVWRESENFIVNSRIAPEELHRCDLGLIVDLAKSYL